MSESPFRIVSDNPEIKKPTAEYRAKRLEETMVYEGGKSAQDGLFTKIDSFVLINVEPRLALRKLSELMHEFHTLTGLTGEERDAFLREHQTMIDVCRDQLNAIFEFEGIPGLNRAMLKGLQRCSKNEEYEIGETVFQLVALEKADSLITEVST